MGHSVKLYAICCVRQQHHIRAARTSAPLDKERRERNRCPLDRCPIGQVPSLSGEPVRGHLSGGRLFYLPMNTFRRRCGVPAILAPSKTLYS